MQGPRPKHLVSFQTMPRECVELLLRSFVLVPYGASKYQVCCLLGLRVYSTILDFCSILNITLRISPDHGGLLYS